ncbi:iron-siderophore ABC transporter substrate-binding protein [Nocardiopsis trehalosi]|uniref:iron-siderophore ABC transporter substrate-binding protein n=1 Tax=Nocardiopsis trehalosi TaxID=109329 RepID=UPI0008336A6A|nr:iron-siderophore ABC transporter substrate-binding protein [Nocardiopsis trehalosi]
MRRRPAPAAPAALRRAAAAALVLAAAACGAPASEEGPAGPADGAFPVEIEHEFGTTEITARPERVVAVGLTEQDALLALGVVPVGTTEWLGAYPGEIGPWAEEALGDAEPPTVLHDEDGPPLEQIADLEPDLILALYADLTEGQYDLLSRLAPTVAQPGGYRGYGIPWQELTETTGAAIGEPEAAERVVARVEGEIAAAREEHPEFAGATAVMATDWDGYFVYGSEDPRSRLLTDLGFALPDGLDAAIGDSFGATLSAERTDMLDTDAVVWLDADPEELHASDLYGGLDVVSEGREVYVRDPDYSNFISFVSPLSLPYQLERLVPELAAAVDGDPGTAVADAAP